MLLGSGVDLSRQSNGLGILGTMRTVTQRSIQSYGVLPQSFHYGDCATNFDTITSCNVLENSSFSHPSIRKYGPGTRTVKSAINK